MRTFRCSIDRQLRASRHNVYSLLDSRWQIISSHTKFRLGEFFKLLIILYFCCGQDGILRPDTKLLWKKLKLNFQAVIKSAASAASPTAWELHGSAPRPSPTSRSRRPGAAMQLPSRRGGCTSSRLDHGLKVELPPIGIPTHRTRSWSKLTTLCQNL